MIEDKKPYPRDFEEACDWVEELRAELEAFKQINPILKDIGLTQEDLDDILAEHQRQIKKWGHEEATPFAWMCYLMEEMGELAMAVNKIYSIHDKVNIEKQDIRKEAIQTATLALKIAAMHRRKK